MSEEKNAEVNNSIKCNGCSSNLTFAPGTDSLSCQYCGALNKIEVVVAQVEEIDFEKFITEKIDAEETQSVTTVKCSNCGAATSLKPNVTSDSCPYCDTALVIKDASTSNIIKPKYVLPFKIERKKAEGEFKSWVGSLWFAPNDLKHKAAESAEKLNGVYLPYWTYDANTTSDYTGERGDYYTVYVTQTVMVDGKPQQQQVPVQKIAWTPAAGTVYNTFDDILVCASHSLPDDITRDLEPWDLPELVNYDDRFLSGFVTESYQLDVKGGLEVAKKVMATTIHETARQDIGGDVQRVGSVDTEYQQVTFKHILLPLWISAYKYNGKVYRFMINARTGEVKGERPYSAIKIVLFVLMILAIIAVIVFFINKKN